MHHPPMSEATHVLCSNTRASSECALICRVVVDDVVDVSRRSIVHALAAPSVSADPAIASASLGHAVAAVERRLT